MPLRFAPGPDNGTALIREGLDRTATRTSPLSDRSVDFSTLQVSQPHPIYDLRADTVVGGGGLASATLSGYRYLITGQGEAVAAAEIQADASLLKQINYGPYVEATRQALTNVIALPAVNAASYEVRVLRFAAIYLVALWLKADSGGADIVYPLAPAPPGVQANTPYSADDFIRAILPLAEKRASSRGESGVP